MNAIKKGSVAQVTNGENMKLKRHNISQFLRGARSYGVSAEKLFHVEDLLLLTNVPRVTECLFELGRLANGDSNFAGPYLGEAPSAESPIDYKTKRRIGGMPEGKRKRPFE